MQATELVNEAYLRLVGVQHVDWQNRTHFMAMSARLMRRVLVDLARSRGADKRGGGAVRVTFDEAALGDPVPHADVIRLDAALEVSSKTVLRDWEFARAWLQRELTREASRDA